MTETEAPATQPLTSILAQVKVTASDGILLLNALLEANQDRSPTLVASLNDAITKLASGESEEPPVTQSETTPTY